MGNAERMRIGSTGNVGIGTNNPQLRLDVRRDGGANTSGDYLALDLDVSTTGTPTTLASGLRFKVDGVAGARITSSPAKDLIFKTNDAFERARITDTGSMVLGKYDQAKLTSVHIGASGTNKGPVFAIGNTNTSVVEDDYVGTIAFRTDDASYTGSVQNGVGAQISCISENSFGSAYGLQFWTGNSADVGERVRIDSTGNFTVGSDGAVGNGSSTAGVTLTQNPVGVGQVRVAKTLTGTHGAVANYHNGTYVGGLNVSDTTTTLVASSDERLKKNIVDAPAGNIEDIKVRSFDWKSTDDHQEYGVIAQELNEVAPYAVYHNEEEDHWGVDYAALVPMLVKEIQDLKAKVEALENV